MISKAMEPVLKLFLNDRFARRLGITIEEIREGYARCRMPIEEKMLNGKDIIQGGALFALCDFTMAVAANSRGQVAFTVNAAITYLRGMPKGETLTAETVELSCGNKIANYRVNVFDSKNELVAVFNGTCNRTGERIPGSTPGGK